MEVIAWSIISKVLFAIGGAWLGIAWSGKYVVEPLVKECDFWRKHSREWEKLYLDTTEALKSSIALTELATNKYIAAQNENAKLRTIADEAISEAVYWRNKYHELERVEPCDNQAQWKVSELARKVQTWEGEM